MFNQKVCYAKITAYKSGLTTVGKRQNKNPIPVSKNILQQAELARDRLYRLQYVTTALAQAATSIQIAEIIASLGATALKASGSTVWLFDENKKLYVAAYKGFHKEQIDQITQIQEEGSTPTLDSVRFKRPIYIRSLEDMKRLYPNTVELRNQNESVISIPLLIADSVLGVINLVFDRIHEFTAEEQEFMYVLVQQCAQALDRARLYDEELQQKLALQTTLERINSLQKVTVSLAKAATPQEIANIVLMEGMRLLAANGGELAVISEDKKTIRRLVSKGYSDPSHETNINWDEFPIDRPLLWVEVIKKNKPLIVSDLSQVPEKYKTAREFAQFTGFYGLVIIPLRTESHLQGVFSLYFGKNISLTQEEIDFLSTLAQQFAQAYDRAHLYENEKSQREEFEDLLRRITTLQEVTRLLSSALTSEEVSAIILKQGVKAMGAMGGEVALLNQDHTKFKILAYRGYSKEYTKNFNEDWQEIPHTEPMLMWDAVREKKNIFLPDIMALPRQYKKGRAFAQLTNAKSSATIPLIVDEKPFGTFFLLFKNRNFFSDEDKNFIITLAQHAAQALERSRIYEKEREISEHLRQSEESWKQLAETIPHLVWTGDVNGKVDYYNKRWEEYTGLSPEKMITQGGWLNVVETQDIPHIKNLWEKSFQQKKPFEGEYRLRSKNGEYRWFLTKALPIKNRKGKIIRWFGTVTDIHQQKMIAEELEKKEARFRSLIENSSDAIVLIDHKGIMQYSSPSTARITGYTPEERVGKSVYTSIYPKDLEKVKHFIHELSESSSDKLLTLQYRRINKDGSIPWMEAIGRNLLQNPNVGALVVNYRNITEGVESEQAIRQAKDELEVILENVAEAITVWGSKGNILYANNAAVVLNRYESKEELYEEVSIRNFLSRFESFFDENGEYVPEDHFPSIRALTEKKPVYSILRFIFREDHKEQWRATKAVPIFDSQGNLSLIVVVSHDITNEKQQEKVKDEFISTASHELKTPITSAKLYSGILSEKIQQFGDTQTYSMITKLDAQLDRLTKLINDLLDVSKIKAGKILFTKRSVEIESLLKDIVDEMQYTTITHHLIFSGKSKKILQLDKERVRQVFINLISNAIKYSPRADRVDILLQETVDGVNICVQDYGVGIEKSEQDKIFEPFYRSGSRNFPGLGLGLHIASEIIKRHGGKMWVESIPDRGTKMYVFLPGKRNRE